MRNPRHLDYTRHSELHMNWHRNFLSVTFFFFFLESPWKWSVPFTYQLDTSLSPTWTENNWVSLSLIEYLDSYHHSPPPLMVSYLLIWLCSILLLWNFSHIPITLGLRSLFYFVLSLKISQDALWIYIYIYTHFFIIIVSFTVFQDLPS